MRFSVLRMGNMILWLGFIAIKNRTIAPCQCENHGQTLIRRDMDTDNSLVTNAIDDLRCINGSQKQVNQSGQKS